jgi:hypothetical protein
MGISQTEMTFRQLVIEAVKSILALLNNIKGLEMTIATGRTYQTCPDLI